MVRLWRRDNRLLKASVGGAPRVLLCDECPCDTGVCCFTADNVTRMSIEYAGFTHADVVDLNGTTHTGFTSVAPGAPSADYIFLFRATKVISDNRTLRVSAKVPKVGSQACQYGTEIFRFSGGSIFYYRTDMATTPPGMGPGSSSAEANGTLAASCRPFFWTVTGFAEVFSPWLNHQPAASAEVTIP